ncbi:PadR family transcriptional regulator [Kitasatospora sp. NPDC058965]|uniref:PadR family transcriptional regulator n=1 Tax=Kitasatospora sp. NPDC058965 TaxID=3346682 RepID=UPI0036CA6400
MSLRYAVLGLLVGQPASGYDLMKVFNTSLANVWPATQSQVYGELARLADAGLIDVAAEGPRGRKEYTLTESGLTELRRWMVEEQPEAQRNSLLLRVFFLGALTPDQATDYLGFLAARAAGQQERLRQLRESLDWTEEGMLTANGRLVMEYGRRLFAMQEEWAQWAIAQLAAAEGGA